MNLNRKDILANELCNVNYCIKEFVKCKGKLHNNCQSREYSCIAALSDEQLDYIFSSIDNNTYLNACPGSGKTEVIGIKVAHEIKKWEAKNKGIAVLTFTNSAEDEILNRVSIFLNRPLNYPHFVGTFTSWLHGYIANPYLYSYVSDEEKEDKSIHVFDSDSYNKIVLNFCTKYKYGVLNKINPTQYYESLCHKKILYKDKEKQEILDQLLEKDGWRKDELIKKKNSFNKANLYTYEDVEHMVYKLLKTNKELVKLIRIRFPIIFIDECQDLSRIQISILERLRLEGVKIHLIGDLDQSIYDFRWVNPVDTQKYIQKKDYHEMLLAQNYRSCQKIVDITGKIIDRKKEIIGKPMQLCSQPLRVIFYEKGCEEEAIITYQKILEIEKINKEKSFVIVRNNNLKQKIIGDKSSKENTLESMAKAIHFYKSYKSSDDFVELFIHAGKAVNKIFFGKEMGGNKSNFYCPDCFAKDKWRLFVYDVIKTISSKEDLSFTCTWNDWKKSLLLNLGSIKELYNELRESDVDLGRVRNKMGETLVQDMFEVKDSIGKDINITTIHGAKGMSYDSVLFFSSYQKSKKDSGAHWTQWFDTECIAEKNRLAYVSFSRAKHLLVLAIPKLKNSKQENFKEIFDYGFVE